MAPLCSIDHMAVTTVEGIGSTRTKIHPVQVCEDQVHILIKLYAHDVPFDGKCECLDVCT